MKEHPISNILKTSMIELGELIDVGKVVGSPIMLPDKSIAIPLTKVSCGFAVGGSEFNNKNPNQEFAEEIFPFGGGTGGGVSITPTALIIINRGKIRITKIEKNGLFVEKVIDSIKDIIKK